MINKTICKILAVSIAFVIIASGITVGANTRASDSNISLSSSIINVPGDFDTIQEAVWNAAEGDTITVNGGTYRENVWVSVDQITLRGVGMPVVDAEGKGDAFALFGEGITLEGFVATNSSYVQQGIKVTGEKNTIKDNIAINNYQGIVFSHAYNNTITGNNVSHNQYAGIQLEYSTGNRISNNGGSNNSWGISLDFTSTNNTIEKNTINDGIRLSSSSNNTITGNNITNYKYDGISLSNSNNNIISDSTAKSVRWGIHLSRSRNNTITDNTFNENEMGIYFDRSNNNTVKDNSASNNNEIGIKLYESNNNTISLNKVNYNKGDSFFIDSSGIDLSYSHNNTITDNIARYNNKTAIYFFQSDNNTLTKNTCSNNDDYGISLFASHYNNLTKNTCSNNDDYGISLDVSNYNILTNNTALNNDRGIYFDHSHYNNLTKNTASNNIDYGIYLDYSKNNTIYNNYFNNTKNAYDDDYGNNTWNITKTPGTNIVGGPYLGGNYWSDYDGVDLDGDKLGDTLLPYNCSGEIENGGDYQPLIIIPKIILKASKDGYASVKHEIDNDENFERIEISGNVTDKSTGEPIEGAKVEIIKGASPAFITTDANGTYTITAIIPEGSGSDTREDVNFELTPSQYIVGVHEITTEVIELIEENNGTIIDQCQYEDGPRALLVYISEEENIDDFINNVRGSPLVKYVELNGIVHACYIPNDPLYPSQWGPQNIHAGGPLNPSAWDVETGDKNVTIAIVDSGIQYNHEDLYRFNDGTIKYVYGYDWVDRDDDPSPGRVQENHGTHCTGIATAVMDNHKGIAGIAPNCSFIAERVMHTFWRPAHWEWKPYIGNWVWVGGRWRTWGGNWNIARGIMDAADHDADVISMSFGGDLSEFGRDATLYASSLGCILAAAAGNDANKKWYEGGICYPAAYSWVIAVGATNQQNLRAPFSQWGPQLELVAPGVEILSTVPWNNYESEDWDGTSMATPHVAGVAALVKSRAERWPEEPLATNPWYHLNNDQIRQVLIQSAVDLDSPGWDDEYGYGKVDAGRAVRCVNISGNVLESVLNAPIPSVEVRVTSIEGPSGVYSTNENTTLAKITKDGDYFVRVPPGVYSICAMAYGYIPSRGLGGERVELPAFDLMGRLNEEYRELRLVPFPCNVTGNVTDGVTGLPIEDAFVSLDGPPHIYPPHPDVHMETETNSNGNYHLILEYGVHPPYPTGEAVYNITVRKSGYQTQNRNFTLNWSDVVKDYYKCPLDPNDYNPPIVNFSLLSGPSELPDLTLTSEDIQFIPPSSNSTSLSSSKQTTLVDISNQDNRFIPPSFKPVSLTEHTIGNLRDNEKTSANLHGTIRSARPYKRSIPRGVSETGVTISSSSAPSFMIENLTYLPTVNPNQTFHVTVDTNYSFDTTTYVFAGIWDYNASEYIAETPANETLSGTGNMSYTFNLTAPLSGIMSLSADLYYRDGYSWIWTDYRDFTVNVSEEEPDFTITATPSSQTISQGDSASYIVSLTSQNGFNLPVTLNISGLPSGVTGIFNPNPVTPSNSSNLTLKTSKITPTDNYTLTITGVGGEITHQTTVTLNITGKGNIATIFATIHNIGTTDASDVTVQLFDGDPTAGGVQIGSNQIISTIPAGDTGSAQVSWDITGKAGSHVIYVRIDPYNTIAESNEDNNQASKQLPIPGVTCSDPKVVIDYTKTSVTDDPVSEGYDISNAPANMDLTTAKGFNISATGPDGAYLFNITFPSPVIESFVLYKLPAWTEIPYTIIGPYTIQVQLDITGGVLDPAFILASVATFDTDYPENPYPSILGFIMEQ